MNIELSFTALELVFDVARTEIVSSRSKRSVYENQLAFEYKDESVGTTDQYKHFKVFIQSDLSEMRDIQQVTAALTEV